MVQSHTTRWEKETAAIQIINQSQSYKSLRCFTIGGQFSVQINWLITRTAEPFRWISCAFYIHMTHPTPQVLFRSPFMWETSRPMPCPGISRYILIIFPIHFPPLQQRHWQHGSETFPRRWCAAHSALQVPHCELSRPWNFTLHSSPFGNHKCSKEAVKVGIAWNSIDSVSIKPVQRLEEA